MTAPDLIAQATVATLLLLALWQRDLLNDMTDGNVERLEREDRDAAEAHWWLAQIGLGK